MGNKFEQAKIKRGQVYRFYCDYYDRHGYGPTCDEVCGVTGITKGGHLVSVIDHLIGDGKLVRNGQGWRNILPADYHLRRQGTFSLPYFGKISADNINPIAVLDSDPEHILEEVSALLLPRHVEPAQCFILRVAGDSMTEARIFNDDYVIIERRESYREGEILAFWLMDTHAVTLKRALSGKREGLTKLTPESHKQEVRVEFGEDVIALGRVVSVFRKIGAS